MATLLGMLLNFFVGGGWVTPVGSFLTQIELITAGAIIYIGLFFSDAVDILKESRDPETSVTPMSRTPSGELP